jgi:hypothetical protein
MRVCPNPHRWSFQHPNDWEVLRCGRPILSACRPQSVVPEDSSIECHERRSNGCWPVEYSWIPLPKSRPWRKLCWSTISSSHWDMDLLGFLVDSLRIFLCCAPKLVAMYLFASRTVQASRTCSQWISGSQRPVVQPRGTVSPSNVRNPMR